MGERVSVLDPRAERRTVFIPCEMRVLLLKRNCCSQDRLLFQEKVYWAEEAVLSGECIHKGLAWMVDQNTQVCVLSQGGNLYVLPPGSNLQNILISEFC